MSIKISRSVTGTFYGAQYMDFDDDDMLKSYNEEIHSCKGGENITITEDLIRYTLAWRCDREEYSQILDSEVEYQESGDVWEIRDLLHTWLEDDLNDQDFEMEDYDYVEYGLVRAVE